VITSIFISISDYFFGILKPFFLKLYLFADALRRQIKIVHPENSDLAYLYGTIVTDGKDEYSQEITANCCVFAEREVTFVFFTLWTRLQINITLGRKVLRYQRSNQKS
jgi:hypothetical protein